MYNNFWLFQTQSVAKAVDEFRYADAIALRGKSFQNNLEIYRTLNNRTIPERATSVTDRKVCLFNFFFLM